MELINSIQLFTCTYKLNGLVDNRTDRECCTTTGVTVKLSQYYTVEVEAIIKFFCSINSILSGHGVYHEKDLIRVDGFLNSSNFVHHLFVYSQTPGCIDDYKIVSFGFSFFNCILCNFYRILTIRFRVHRHFNLFSQYTKLFDSSRTIHVTGYEQRFAILFSFEHPGQLSGEGSLTRTLQTGHQDNSRMTICINLNGFSTHQLSKFVVNDFHHQLAWFHSSKYVLSQRFFFYCIGKSFRYLVVNVGIQQGFTHIFQCFCYIDLSDFTFTF